MWKGQKVHLGHSQEAYDAECAAIIRTLRIGRDRRRQHRKSRFLQMRRLQLSGCKLWKLALGRSLPYRRDVSWQKLTVQWRFDGVRPTRELQGTRKPINGRKSLRESHMSVVWNS